MITTFFSYPDYHDIADPENVTRGTFLPLTVDDQFNIFDWCLTHAAETSAVECIQVTIHWKPK